MTRLELLQNGIITPAQCADLADLTKRTDPQAQAILHKIALDPVPTPATENELPDNVRWISTDTRLPASPVNARFIPEAHALPDTSLPYTAKAPRLHVPTIAPEIALPDSPTYQSLPLVADPMPRPEIIRRYTNPHEMAYYRLCYADPKPPQGSPGLYADCVKPLSPANTTDAPQCVGRTKDSKRCKRNARADYQTCKQHADQEPRSEFVPTSPLYRKPPKDPKDPTSSPTYQADLRRYFSHHCTDAERESIRTMPADLKTWLRLRLANDWGYTDKTPKRPQTPTEARIAAESKARNKSILRAEIDSLHKAKAHRIKRASEIRNAANPTLQLKPGGRIILPQPLDADCTTRVWVSQTHHLINCYDSKTTDRLHRLHSSDPLEVVDADGRTHYKRANPLVSDLARRIYNQDTSGIHPDAQEAIRAEAIANEKDKAPRPIDKPNKNKNALRIGRKAIRLAEKERTKGTRSLSPADKRQTAYNAIAYAQLCADAPLTREQKIDIGNAAIAAKDTAPAPLTRAEKQEIGRKAIAAEIALRIEHGKRKGRAIGPRTPDQVADDAQRCVDAAFSQLRSNYDTDTESQELHEAISRYRRTKRLAPLGDRIEIDRLESLLLEIIDADDYRLTAYRAHNACYRLWIDSSFSLGYPDMIISRDEYLDANAEFYALKRRYARLAHELNSELELQRITADTLDAHNAFEIAAEYDAPDEYADPDADPDALDMAETLESEAMALDAQAFQNWQNAQDAE